MMKRILGAMVVAVALSACGTTAQSQQALEGSSGGDSSLCELGLVGQAINSTGPVPEGCLKIEGGDIGRTPQTLEFSGITVTITGWTNKDGEGDQIGFTFESTAPVAYAVKAGGKTYAGEDASWVHPKGTSGPEASGISNITFCPAPPEGENPGLPENPGTGGDSDADSDSTGGETPDRGGQCPPAGGGIDEGSGSDGEGECQFECVPGGNVDEGSGSDGGIDEGTGSEGGMDEGTGTGGDSDADSDSTGGDTGIDEGAGQGDGSGTGGEDEWIQ